jgi:hypothetical protein
MVKSSQNLNPSYGYLCWLNGKESMTFPSLPNLSHTSLSKNTPNDLFAGMGKNGQFIEIFPNKNFVVIRMGKHLRNLLFQYYFITQCGKR